MSIGVRSLTRKDTEQVFRLVTWHFPQRYADEINTGMTDDQLKQALKDCLGIAGGINSKINNFHCTKSLRDKRYR